MSEEAAAAGRKNSRFMRFLKFFFTDRDGDPVPAGSQAFFVALGTLLSGGYAISMMGFFIEGDGTPPTLFIVLFIVSVLPLMIYGHKYVDEWVKKARSEIVYALVFASASLCMAILGYLTTFTGGAYKSPFTVALLAMALLSLHVAAKPISCVLSALIALAVFWFFGETNNAPGPLVVPSWVIFTTAAINVAISLSIDFLLRANPKLKFQLGAR